MAETAETQQVSDNTAQGTQEQPQAGAVKRFGRGITKTAFYLSGADVIWKDSRRVRPRHPQLWKDIWNARKILREQKKADIKQGKSRIPLWKARRNAMVTMIVGLCVCGYGIALIAGVGDVTQLRFISKISLIALIVVGLLQVIVYGWITLKLTQRQLLMAKRTQTQMNTNKHAQGGARQGYRTKAPVKHQGRHAR
ncbi:MAG: Uncharacterized protein AWU57_3 [Marinobacter sp. T13-3]|nr:MAG: Uncharacterized protein AWU57_3 [Marinobacter sp. T13-3]